MIWSQAKHVNILPLLGIMTMEGLPCMVSEWMENGTMPAYLKGHADVDVFELVSSSA